MKKHLTQILTSEVTVWNIMLFTDCMALIIMGYSQFSLRIIDAVANGLLIISLFVSLKSNNFSLKSLFLKKTEEKLGYWRIFIEIYVIIALFLIPNDNPEIRKLIADITVGLLFCLISYSYYYLTNKHITQQESIESLTAEITSIMDKEESVDREVLNRIFKRQFAAVDRLAAVRYESTDEKTLNKNYAREAKRMISELEPNSAEMAELKQYINSTRDNLITRFEESFPNLNPYYYQLFLYTAIGLSPRAMSVLFDIPVETIYNRKSRLKNIISSANAGASPKFLEAIA